MLAENKITLASLYKILFEEEPLTLSDQCMQKLEESFHFLKTFSNDKIIYGINTGFGPMAQYRIEDESLSQLQYNIIRSHATGAGQPLPELYVKAAMIALSILFCKENPAYIKNWHCSLPSLSTGGLLHTYPNTAV